MKPDESEIRTITSAVPLTELPSKDGETNMHFIHALYARYQEDYVVMIDKVWILF